jgi:hypothetical protein
MSPSAIKGTASCTGASMPFAPSSAMPSGRSRNMKVQHLLGGDVADRVAPAGDGFELLGREPLVRALLERGRREQVLAMIPCSSSAAWHSM